MAKISINAEQFAVVFNAALDAKAEVSGTRFEGMFAHELGTTLRTAYPQLADLSGDKIGVVIDTLCDQNVIHRAFTKPMKKRDGTVGRSVLYFPGPSQNRESAFAKALSARLAAVKA